MKRWILIFIAVVVLSKLLATSMLSLMPETSTAIIEKVATAVEILKPTKDTQVETLQPAKKIVWPKVNLPPTKAFLAYNKVLAPQNVPPKTQVAHEEKTRRKKRKKKLEEAANKKKESQLTVLKTTGHDDKKLKFSENENGPYSLLISNESPADDSNKTNTALPVSKPKVNLTAWTKLLTQTPNSNDFKTFLNFYKTGIISAHEYYSVVDLMQKSSNIESRRLAVMGSSIEAHPEAFQILVHEKYSEKDPSLQELAINRLLVYKDVKYFGSLVQPLSAGDTVVKTETSTILGQIAQSVVATPSALTPDTKNWFTRFASLLTPLTKEGNPETLQMSATQTLMTIHSILG